MKKLALLLPFLCFVLVVEAQKFDLSLNLEVGKTYHNSMVSTGSVSQNIMGQTIDFDMIVSAGMDFKVIEKSADSYNLNVQYRKLSMQIKNQQMNMNFSSDSADTSSPIGGLLSKMTGQSFLLKMNDKGKILEVSGFDKLINSMVESMSALPEAQREQMLKQMQDSYGEEALKGNLGSMLSTFPEKPVAVGDSWPFSIQVNTGMALGIQANCKLINADGDVYTIVTEGTMATPADAANIEASGIKMQMEMRGTTSSEIKIDKKTGWIVSGTGLQELYGKTKILPSDQMPEGMEIPMKVSTNTIYTGE